MPKTLVIVPTYNERENIEPLIEAIHKNVADADVLVVDDQSPDGTGKLIDSIAKNHSFVHCLHRTKKEGLGRAYVAGFKWAIDRQYQYVVTMDADFSHDPKYLPSLINEANEKTVVVGSRYVPGGKIEGWATWRYLNSSVANIFTRTILGLKPKDSTAGFKCYPRSFLEKLDLESVLAAGYAFQVEMIMRAQDFHFQIKEVPITFVDRRVGESKISGEARRSMKVVLQLAGQREGIKQFIKFGVIGVANVGVDWTIYFVEMYFFPFTKVVAKAVSFVAAACNSYYFNRSWTFKSSNPNVMGEFVKFFVVASIGAVFNTSIFWAVSVKTGFPDIVGLFTATALVTVWNFLINKYWTFKK